MDARPEPRIFWPAAAALSVVLAVQNRSRLTLPPNIICLFAYLALAGASVLWAFSPQSSFVRFVQQAMVVTSIVLPAMLANRTVDMMRGMFLCFACALILNVFFILSGSVTIARYGSKLVDIGYQGYFEGKNYLGECAAIAFLLSIREVRCPGWARRALGIIVFMLAILLVFLSDSKTALGLALISPFLASLTLRVRKMTRVSAAIILLSIPLSYIVLSHVTHFSMNRVSYMLYGDSTFTGRTIIWDFAQHEIDLSPLLGWGYQSFWLVPGSPSLEAPGWVKMMPNAHNGYYDSMLELGYIGLAFLLVFLAATLHAIGRVADSNLARARLLLSLALFIIMYNFLESLWMRGFEFLWVTFVIVAAETGRCFRPFTLRGAEYRSTSAKPGNPGPLAAAQTPGLRIRLP
jgi:O-antigen ligase